MTARGWLLLGLFTLVVVGLITAGLMYLAGTAVAR